MRRWALALLVSMTGCPDAPDPAPEATPLLPITADATAAEGLHFTRLSLEVEGRTTVLERRGSAWWMTSPVHFPADPVAVDELVAVLRRGALRTRIAEAPDAQMLRTLGLDPPRLRLVAEVEGGPTQVLEAGEEQPFDGSIAVRRGGESGVFSASGHLRRVLERDAHALRAKRLFPFRPEDVVRLSVASGSTAWKLERGAEGWRQTLPPEFEADPERILHLLRRLVGLQARSFSPDDAAGREAHGLKAPAWVLELEAKGKAPIRVEVSSLPPGPDRTVWVRWQVPEAEPTLARVDGRLLELAAIDPATLRATRLLRFDADAVTRVELTFGDGAEVLLVRPTDGGADGGPGARDWSVTVGETHATVSPHRVASLLWQVAQLRATAPRDPKVDARVPPEAGLASLRLLDGAGTVLGSLRFGRADVSEERGVAVETGEVHAFTSGEAVAALRQATRPESWGVGQREDGGQGATSPKKMP